MNRKKIKMQKPSIEMQEYLHAIEKGKKNKHVVPAGEKGWAVKKPFSKKVIKYFPTQSEATSYAKEIAVGSTQVFIHGKDGRVKDRHEIKS